MPYCALFALLLTIVDKGTTHFKCDDPLGLVVDDSASTLLHLTSL